MLSRARRVSVRKASSQASTRSGSTSRFGIFTGQTASLVECRAQARGLGSGQVGELGPDGLQTGEGGLHAVDCFVALAMHQFLLFDRQTTSQPTEEMEALVPLQPASQGIERFLAVGTRRRRRQGREQNGGGARGVGQAIPARGRFAVAPGRSVS